MNQKQYERILAETRIEVCRSFGELPSTNDYAKMAWSDGSLTSPALVITDLQTAGRGRGNNVWVSSGKDLTFSLVFPRDLYPIAAGELGPISLWTAIGVGQGLAAIADVGIQWKWPNDIFANGKKLGGILIESLAAPTPALIVGIGVNLGQHPGHQAAISLAETTAKEVDRFDVLLSMISAIEAVWDSALDGDLTAAWATGCLLDGRPVRVQTTDCELRGTFVGVEASGAMLLRVDGETKPIFSASVAIL